MDGDGDINRTTWYKMYQMQKDFGNDVVGSSMIWGCQHDQVLKFVDGKLDRVGVTFSVTTADNSRHSGSGTTGTGNIPADCVANIYDFEGNMREFTLEAYGTDNRALHGGYYYYPSCPASERLYDIPPGVGLNIGSRLSLYVE